MIKSKVLIAAFVFAIIWSTGIAVGVVGKDEHEYSLISAWGSTGTSDDQFNVPRSIAFDSAGNMYVSDSNNHCIQKFTSDGTFITKWGTEGSADGQFLLPLGINTDSSDNVYVVDQGQATIHRFTSDGNFIAKREIESSIRDTEVVLEDVEIDSQDDIFVTDRENNKILKLSN